MLMETSSIASGLAYDGMDENSKIVFYLMIVKINLSSLEFKRSKCGTSNSLMMSRISWEHGISQYTNG